MATCRGRWSDKGLTIGTTETINYHAPRLDDPLTSPSLDSFWRLDTHVQSSLWIISAPFHFSPPPSFFHSSNNEYSSSFFWEEREDGCRRVNELGLRVWVAMDLMVFLEHGWCNWDTWIGHLRVFDCSGFSCVSFFFLLFDFHLFLKRPALCNIQFSLSPLFGIVIRMYCIIIGIKFIRIKMCTL